MGDRVHVASAVVDATADEAFSFLRDPQHLSQWAKGLRDQQVLGTDLIAGRLAADGSRHYCRIEAVDATRGVLYRLGPDPQALVARIMSQVMPGEDLGLGAGRCVVSLTAWRTGDMDASRWRSLQSSHEAEARLIADLIGRIPRARYAPDA